MHYSLSLSRIEQCQRKKYMLVSFILALVVFNVLNLKNLVFCYILLINQKKTGRQAIWYLWVKLRMEHVFFQKFDEIIWYVWFVVSILVIGYKRIGIFTNIDGFLNFYSLAIGNNLISVIWFISYIWFISRFVDLKHTLCNTISVKHTLLTIARIDISSEVLRKLRNLIAYVWNSIFFL